MVKILKLKFLKIDYFNKKDIYLRKFSKHLIHRKDIKNFDQYEYLYSKEFWPDFSKLISGDMSTIVYNIKGSRENYTMRKIISGTSSHGMNIIIVIILIAIILKIIIKIRQKK